MTWEEFLARARTSLPELHWPDVLPAVLAGMLVVIGLKAGLALLRRRLQTLAGRTRSRVDDGLLCVLESTHAGLIWSAGALVALGLLPLDGRWQDRVGQLWFAVIAVQIGLWGQQAIAACASRSNRRPSTSSTSSRPRCRS